MESYSEQLGIIFGNFLSDYPNTRQLGNLILSTIICILLGRNYYE